MDNDKNDLFGKFTAWMKLVVKHAKIDYIRRNKHRQFECSIEDNMLNNLLHYEDDYCKLIDNFDFNNDKLKMAFSKLTLLRKRVLIMLFVKNMSIKEVANELKSSFRNVINLRYLAMRDLRKNLRDKGE